MSTSSEQQLKKIFQDFNSSYPDDITEKSFERIRNAFHIFWTNKIMKDKIEILDEFVDLDPIIRLLDPHGKRRYEYKSNEYHDLKENLIKAGKQYSLDSKIINEASKGIVTVEEPYSVAFCMIPQPSWYKIFHDLKKSKELRSKLNEIFEETNLEKKASLVDHLKNLNSTYQNLLTAPQAVALNAMLFCYSPSQYVSVVSLRHRKIIVTAFDSGNYLESWTYGEQVILSNEVIKRFNEKYSTEFNARKLSEFFYQKQVEPLWKLEESTLIEDIKEVAPSLNIWIEKTIVSDRPYREDGEYSLGRALWSPQTDARGAAIYKNMQVIKKGDIVLHLTDNDSIAGISKATTDVITDFKCLPGTEWDDPEAPGSRPGFLIRLEGFHRFSNPISRDDILNSSNETILLKIIQSNSDVFYNKKLELRQGAYLTPVSNELKKLIISTYKQKNRAPMPYLETETIEVELPISGVSDLESFQQNIILCGPPGTGKTYKAKALTIEIISKNQIPSPDRIMKLDNYEFNRLKEKDRVAFVVFHPNYTYEEFIEGIKPQSTSEGKITYDIVDGIFKQFCKRAESDPENRYVFLIDEINRGSIPKIFGELIHCIEYRGEKTSLPLSRSWFPNEPERYEFTVPKNLFLLGTMNTADKSIAFVDYALRRRFSFLELGPTVKAIQQYDYDNEETRSKAIALFHHVNRFLGWSWNENSEQWEKIPKEIEARPQDHLVGHTYFFAKNIDQLKEKWEKQVIPLVKEYYFDLPDKLEEVELFLRFDSI